MRGRERMASKETMCVSRKRTERVKNIISGSGSNHLADDVLENILLLLPIKPLVKLSLLSTRFKNSWRFSHDLCFDRAFARGWPLLDFVRIVDRVLSLHLDSKIRRFALHLDPRGLEGKVENWVKMVTSKGVEVFDLDLTQPLRLSFDLLDVQSITTLKLTGCELINLPQKLKGLCLLKTLVLRGLNVKPELIRTLFSNCFRLETLELEYCSKLSVLEVKAQNLKNFKALTVRDCSGISEIRIETSTLCSFAYHGDARRINFKGRAQLNDVILNFVSSRGFPRPWRITDIFMGMDFSSVSVLTVSSRFLEELCPRYVDGKLEPKCQLGNLRKFNFSRDKICNIDPYDIASFLEDCPSLETILIDLGGYCFERGYLWEWHRKVQLRQCSPAFQRLKFIEVKGFKFEEIELEMVRFFLGKAMLLDNLTLVTSKNSQHPTSSNQYHTLFVPWMASPHAQIHIYDHLNAKISTIPCMSHPLDSQTHLHPLPHPIHMSM